jgi:hypothetical protein
MPRRGRAPSMAEAACESVSTRTSESGSASLTFKPAACAGASRGDKVSVADEAAGVDGMACGSAPVRTSDRGAPPPAAKPETSRGGGSAFPGSALGAAWSSPASSWPNSSPGAAVALSPTPLAGGPVVTRLKDNALGMLAFVAVRPLERMLRRGFDQVEATGAPVAVNHQTPEMMGDYLAGVREFSPGARRLLPGSPVQTCRADRHCAIGAALAPLNRPCCAATASMST